MMLCRALAPLLLLVALAHPASSRPPRPAPSGTGELLTLHPTSAQAVQDAWLAAKRSGDPNAQARAAAAPKLNAKICSDLVDLRPLTVQGLLPHFDFRDRIRGRTWARPTLALLLRDAMAQLQREFPNKTITIGDVAQPGCGQVAHGVLLRDLTSQDGENLLKISHREEHSLVHYASKQGADFPWELDRFPSPTARVMVLSRLIGRAPDGRFRAAESRFHELSGPTEAELADLQDTVHHLLRQRPASSERLPYTRWDAASPAPPTPAFFTHLISPSRKRQLVLITKNRPGRRLNWSDVLELRLAAWQDKKPLSFPNEVRWLPGPRPGGPSTARSSSPTAAGTPWTRWALVMEAGHITHLSGIDADLSYVTTGNARHFAVDLGAMDVPATWRWFTLLDETARTLGTPIEVILVDPAIRRHLLANLPKSVKKTRTWRLIGLSPGHDGHHHLRLHPPSTRKENVARPRLLKAP